MHTRSLLACGALAAPVFVGTYTISGRLPAGYDRRRDPVSALARTEIGRTQTMNFLVSGGLTLAGSVGMARDLRSGVGTRSLPLLVGAVGVGLVGAGIFATDTAEETARRGLSRRGALHVVSAVPFFVGLPAACAVGSLRFYEEGSHVLSVASVNTGVLSIVAATLAGAGFGGSHRLGPWAGAFQRIAVVAGLGWMSALMALLRRRSQPRNDGTGRELDGREAPGVTL